jgi:ABC-type spermidine/putrescine transport system permease subunit I
MPAGLPPHGLSPGPGDGGAARPPRARGRTGGRLATLGLLVPAVGLLAVFFVVPLGKVALWSLVDARDGGLTLAYYARALTEPIYVRVMLNTFRISLYVTLLCLLLGYPVAYVLATVRPRVASLLMIFVVLPFWISLLVRLYAWIVLLQKAGVVNSLLLHLGLVREPLPLVYNLTGVVIGMVHVLLPFMILPLYSVMKGIDPNLMAAARNLGGTPVQAFRRVFLPLTYPGIGAGMLMVFMLSIGYFVTPALLGGLKETFIAQLIEQQVSVLIDWHFAAALAVLLLAVTLVIYYVFNRVLGLDRIWGGV